MSKGKPDDKYTKEAKKLLAWWQDSLRQQWQHPDTLNAWLNAMQTHMETPKGPPHATTRPAHANADGHDELQSVRAELRTLRTKLSKLERELESLRGKLAGAKPKPKPVRAKQPVRKPEPVRRPAKPKRKPTRK